MSVRLAVDAHAQAGESPWWAAGEQRLYWVDIHGRRLHRFDPASGLDDAREMPDLVTFAATHAAGGVVVALRDRVGHLDWEAGRLRALLPLPVPAGGRLNDGTIDPRGRLVIGAMCADDAPAPAAALFVVEGAGAWRVLVDGFRTVNGLAFSPDGRTLYVSDSHPSVRTVWAYDYAPAQARVGSRRVFVDTHGMRGRPDGGCVDAHGHYWMAAVDGACLMRFDAQGGVRELVELPVDKPSKAAFGGPRLDRLYVTSLRRRLARPLEAQPHAGGVFELDCEVAGAPLPDCAIALR
jgi:sugar lactone lactonase YvrE